MDLEAQVEALRQSVAITGLAHVRLRRVSGAHAYDAMAWLCPRELFLRDGQVLQTVLLRQDGSVFADAAVGLDDESYLLWVEGPSEAQLDDYLCEAIPPALAPTIDDLNTEHAQIGLDGPYAWELMGRLFGEDVIGLPYQTLFYADQTLCVRAGKTGEYGYHLVVPREHTETLLSRIHEVGAAFDAATGSLEALDLCALENGFFNMRAEGRLELTPFELQLQWRCSRRKVFHGSEALEAHRGRFPPPTTTVVSPQSLSSGASVWLDEQLIGRIAHGAYSFVHRQHVGLALLDLPFAHPGVARYTVDRDGARQPLRTASPPLNNNRSLYVRAQKHSYRQRRRDAFPALV
jgi:glycine cleavage system aminomethyltransferase T